MPKRPRLQLMIQRTVSLHILALANAQPKLLCFSAVLPLHLRINA
jgi:hypothetical protein